MLRMSETKPPQEAPVIRGSLYWLAPDLVKDRFRHPHLVVQDDVFNASRIPTVIVCALSSNLQKATEPGNVLLHAGEGGLPLDSVVVVSQLPSLRNPPCATGWRARPDASGASPGRFAIPAGGIPAGTVTGRHR